MLDYRNDEHINGNGSALHKHIEKLKENSYHMKHENETMASLAKQNQKDTRSFKALSVLGTMYQPATFIAVSHAFTCPPIILKTATTDHFQLEPCCVAVSWRI